MPDIITSTAALRICTVCGRTHPLTPDFFDHRAATATRNAWIDRRCIPCARARSREVARLYRQGRPVRGSSRARRALLANVAIPNVLDGTRRIGVEIEFIGRDYHRVITEMRARGLRVEYMSYNHQVQAGWKIITDASVHNGYELVSPPMMGADAEAQITLAMQALTAAGCSVDSSCGLHVHHEVRDLTLTAFQTLYANWADNQGAVDGLVARSRRRTQWAQPITLRDRSIVNALPSMNEVNTLSYIGRYRSLNVACFPRYGTVEVRQHQGTLNAKKIIHWAAFAQSMIRAAIAGTTVSTHHTNALLDTLTMAHGLPTASHAYLSARANAFAQTDSTRRARSYR